MNVLDNWLGRYNILSQEDLYQAKREIMQEIALAGLARGGFFDHASFYGGTALRIFYGIKRFSEDLDFSLDYKDKQFSFEKFIPYIIDEFKVLGLDVELSIKSKTKISAIESAFLKDNSVWGVLQIWDKKNASTPTVKVKIEIDKEPPLKFESEPKLLLQPYSFYVNCMKEEFLFAGKMHALLFRQWKNRVKGRDWYDFEWFVRRGTQLNLDHLKERSVESGHWDKEKVFDYGALLSILKSRILHLDIELAKADIQRFIQNPMELKIWTRQYFLDVMEQIQVVSVD